jgi:hypothetical protein
MHLQPEGPHHPGGGGGGGHRQSGHTHLCALQGETNLVAGCAAFPWDCAASLAFVLQASSMPTRVCIRRWPDAPPRPSLATLFNASHPLSCLARCRVASTWVALPRWRRTTSPWTQPRRGTPWPCASRYAPACTACPALPVLPACTALFAFFAKNARGQSAVCVQLEGCHRRPHVPHACPLRTPNCWPAPPPPTLPAHPDHPPTRPFLPPLQSTKPEEASRSYERHFDHRDELISRIS